MIPLIPTLLHPKSRPLLMWCFLLLTATTAQGAVTDPWAEQFAIPTSQVLFSTGATFRQCFAVGRDQQWHSCGDEKSALTEDYVKQRIESAHEFTLSSAGKLYLVLEAHIDEKAWLYKHVKANVMRFDASSKRWVNIQVKHYDALYKGDKPLYNYPHVQQIANGEPPVAYTRHPDGSITLITQLPTFEPGRYKLLLRAADRGAGVYLPSSARVAGYVIPEPSSAAPATSVTAIPGSAGVSPSPSPPTPEVAPGDPAEDPPVLPAMELLACADHPAWCYGGGGRLQLEGGYVEIRYQGGCQLHLHLRGVHGQTAASHAPPYALQLYYRSASGAAALGQPLTTDSAGSFSGPVAPCPEGAILGFTLNSAGSDGSHRSYNSGARQQFVTPDYYKTTRVLIEMPPVSAH